MISSLSEPIRHGGAISAMALTLGVSALAATTLWFAPGII